MSAGGAATPFFVTAGVTVLSAVQNGGLQRSAAKAQRKLIRKIEGSGGKVQGLPSAGPEQFRSIASWLGDTGAAATGFLGLLISSILLFTNHNSNHVLVFVVAATNVVLVVFLGNQMASDPISHRTDWAIRVTPIQAALIVCNVVLACTILFVGTEAKGSSPKTGTATTATAAASTTALPGKTAK